MSERCPTCLRPMRAEGEQHDDGVHCPASPRDHRLVRDDLACAQLGIEARDAALASTRALVDRSQQLLVKCRVALDAAIGMTQQHPDHVGSDEGEDRLG